MLKQSTLDFLSNLAQNNHRDWFMANKKAYEAAKLDFEKTVQGIIDGVGAFDIDIKPLKAKDCVFRIYRDVRFAKDKSPYKTNFGAGMAKGGKKMSFAGYYFHLEPGRSMLGGGMYMPEAPVLNAIRQEIDYNTEEFKSILNGKKFKDYFGGLEDMKLKTAPKNYAKDHPEIELLKHTSFVVMHGLTDKELTAPDLVEKAVDVFRTLKPMNDFANRVMA